MSTITKAVIPCGGRGTRFLPITKAVAKEILPIIDTPVLAYIVDEAVNSGITDIMIIINHSKEIIRDYFTPNAQLEDEMLKAGKNEYFDILKNIYSKANIVFAYQEQPKGNGDAILQAEKFTGKESFCLSWGDDLIISKNNPVMGQLIKAHARCGKHIIGCQQILDDSISKYGVAKIGKEDDRLYPCYGFVEKPALNELPSRLTSLGRYVLNGDIYDNIRNTKVSKNGELQISDTLNYLSGLGQVCAYEFEGKRYDMGDKFGSIKAIIELGLQNKTFSAQLTSYIKDLATKI